MYRTKIELVVLSENPIDGLDVPSVVEACDTGDCVLASDEASSETLTGKEMAAALYAAGSEPGFFMLDDEGNHDGSLS